jgi:hypothetical protein
LDFLNKKMKGEPIIMERARKFLIVTLTLILALFIFGCTQPGTSNVENGEIENGQTEAGGAEEESSAEGEEGNKEDVEGAAAEIGEWSITIEVMGEEPLEFSNSDAEQLGPVEIAAAMKDGENIGEEEIWTGILLEDLLEFVNVEEFSVISVISKDGSAREFDPERISEGATGIGWMVNGEPLDAESGPVQFIADQRGPKWWVKQVTKIEIIK